MEVGKGSGTREKKTQEKPRMERRWKRHLDDYSMNPYWENYRRHRVLTRLKNQVPEIHDA